MEAGDAMENGFQEGEETPAVSRTPWCRQDLPDWEEIWAACWQRIRTWRVPPRWSAGDWSEELQAQGAAAAWQALDNYDATRGVPLRVYVHQRVLASALTRSRQEWSYALRFAFEISANDSRDAIEEDESLNATAFEALHQGLANLAEQDRRLIELLFWDGHTEAEVAEMMGISQPAVSKRKWALLRVLRSRLGPSDKND
ncbi:MAG: sigma-70 family RNA polymerase sigma factor [Planctomycetaceae bacterium]|nr:sigma-70 family RNA polymerase sigma factor [Planctomycetaceae bacterium]